MAGKSLLRRFTRLILLFTFFSSFYLSSAKKLEDKEPVPDLDIEEEPVEEWQASFAVLLLTGIEIVAFLVGYIIEQTHFKYLQEAGGTLLIGCIIGGVIRLVSTAETLEKMVTLDSEFFYLVLLPPIIFESGYNMKRRNFFKNIGGIIAFAMLGTLIATFVTAGLLYLVVEMGIMKSDLSFLECLVFGSIISAVDPVTVLAIFKALKVDLDLYSNIFGESVLNDAVAIVLYKTISSFTSKPFTIGNVFLGAGQFLLIFIGSLVVGVIVSLLCALLLKYTQLYKYPVTESAIVLLYAYTAYLIAEGLELSGIVSILFSGITMAHYAWENLSRASKTLTTEMIEVLATLADTLVFAFLGLALFTFNGEYDFVFIVASIIIMLIARAVNIFPISFFVNLTRRPGRKIEGKYQFFMWFSGLRGAIAFILALQFRQKESLEGYGNGGTAIFTTTLMVVFFTVLFFGGLTIPLLQKLDIPTGVDYDKKQAPEPNVFLDFDRKRLKPFFTKRGITNYQLQTQPEEDDPYDPGQVELSEVRQELEADNSNFSIE